MEIEWDGFQWDKPCALIIFDAMGYQEFEEANTPNIDEFIDRKISPAYTQATFTLPSFYSMMVGHLPYKDGNEQIFSRKLWIPNEFRRLGYKTIGIVSLPYAFSLYGLDKGFDKYYQMDEIWQGEDMVDLALSEILYSTVPSNKFFLIMDFGETHKPYRHGDVIPEVDQHKLEEYNYGNEELDEDYIEHLRQCQIDAIEYLDDIIQPLLDRLLEWDALTIITADHGHSWGEDDTVGHGIAKGRDSAAKMLEVPLLFRLPKKNDPNLKD